MSAALLPRALRLCSIHQGAAAAAASQRAHMVQTRRSSARAQAAAPAADAPQQQQQAPVHAAGSVQDRLQGIKNCRDLAEAFSGMRPGLVFRTAAPLSATAADVQLLYSELGIKDLIDLRSSEEIRDDGHSPAFEGTSFCRYRRDPAIDRVVPDATTWRQGDTGVLRVQIPVMEKSRYFVSLLSRLRKRDSLRIVLASLVDKAAGRRLAIQHVNEGGLEQLYEVFANDCGAYFVAALRHIAKSLEGGRPVLFFCKAGKDRTGLLAALLLELLGASEEEILRDYVISDGWHMVGLAGIEDNPKATGLDRHIFERAPREAMHYFLQLVAEAGGAEAYLEAAGLTRQEQQQLRALLLLQDDSAGA